MASAHTKAANRGRRQRIDYQRHLSTPERLVHSNGYSWATGTVSFENEVTGYHRGDTLCPGQEVIIIQNARSFSLFDPETGFMRPVNEFRQAILREQSPRSTIPRRTNAWFIPFCSTQHSTLGRVNGRRKEFTSSIGGCFQLVINYPGREQPDATGLIGSMPQ